MFWFLFAMVVGSVLLTAAYPVAQRLEQVSLKQQARERLAQTSTPCDLVVEADQRIATLRASLDRPDTPVHVARRELEWTKAWRKAVVDLAWNGERPC